MRALACLFALGVAGCGGVIPNTYPERSVGHPLAMQAETLGGERVELSGAGPVRIIDVWAS